MNKDRRKKIAKAIDLMAQAEKILFEVSCEEQEAYDNIPESFQISERGEQMAEYIEILVEAIENLDTTSLEEVAEG